MANEDSKSREELLRDFLATEGAARHLIGDFHPDDLLFDIASSHLPEALYILDPSTRGPLNRILYINQAGLAMHGVELEQVLGRSLAEFAAPETARGMAERLQRILSGERLVLEVELKHVPTNTFFPAEVVTQLVEVGSRQLIVGTARDITQRKEDENFRRILVKLGERLNAVTSPRESAVECLKAADEILGWDAALIAFYSHETNRLSALISYDTIGGVRREVNEDIDQEIDESPLIARAIREGAFLLHDQTAIPGLEVSYFGDKERRSACILYSPMHSTGEHIEAVVSIQSYTPGYYTDRSLELFKVLANYCGSAMERTKTEAELRYREQLYRNAIRSANAVVYEKEYRTGRMVYIADEIEAMIGLPPSQVSGRALQNLMLECQFPDLPPGTVMDTAVQMAEAGDFSLWRCELKVQTRAGEIKWLADQSIQVRDEHDNLVGSLGILVDITDRKNAEARQESLIARLRAIAVFADGLLDAADLDSVYRRAVEFARKRLGVKRCSIFIREKAGFRGTYGTAMDGSTTDERAIYFPGNRIGDFTIEIENPKRGRHLQGLYEMRDGAYIKTGEGWIHATPILDHRKEMLGIFMNDEGGASEDVEGDLQDILILFCEIIGGVIQRKKTEEALIRSQHELGRRESELRMMLDSLPAVIWITDQDLNITHCSGSGLKSQKLSAAEVIGTNIRDWQKETQHPMMVEYHLRALKGESFIYEISVRDIYFQSTIEPMTNEQGEITGVIGISRDISDIHHLEEERRQFELRMQQVQKLESMGILAGGIAHDFNNLLMGVLGNTSLALSALKESDEEIRPMLERAVATAERMSELTQQMLAYSGRGKFVIDQIDLNALLVEMTQLLEVSISKKVKIHFHLDQRAPQIRGDATQIRQIVMNLITNASEAISDGAGDIHLETSIRRCKPRELPVYAWHDDLEEQDYAVLMVRDNGIGMDKDAISRIFDPFYTTKFTGRGLGLSAVQGIIHSHRGAITVESEPGSGTTFRVYIPIATASDSEVPRSNTVSGSEQPDSSSATILIIEDEEVVRNVTTRMLTNSGYTVLLAVDGIDGINTYAENYDKIDIVLLDMTMPNMGGTEVYRELRERRPDLKIILMSGYTEPEGLPEIEYDSNAAFIAKPFRPSKVRELIRSLLSR